MWALLFGVFFIPKAISFDHNWDQVKKIIETQNDLNAEIEANDSAAPSKTWQLNRLDLELGLNKTGEYGILAYGGQSAVEFIWERKNIFRNLGTSLISTERPESEPNEIVIHEAITESLLEKEIKNFIEWKNFKPRKRKKIIKQLYRDASQINRLITALANMPQVGQWYVDGFFKTYQFSKQGDLLGTLSGGVDLRVRFRFEFKGRTSPFSEDQSLSSLQKSILPYLISLQKWTEHENENSKFELRRVWIRTDIEKELDAILFSASMTKGFQLVFRKSRQTAPAPTSLSFSNSHLFKATEIPSDSFLQATDESLASVSKLILNQIRLKFSLSKELGFFISTLGTQSTLDFHFFRREPLVLSLEHHSYSAERIPVLDQVDYRRRLTFGIGFPGVADFRIRPSIEHRYSPKSPQKD